MPARGAPGPRSGPCTPLRDGSPGADRRPQAPVGRPRAACRWPLKAASFRTWPGSRVDIGRDPAIDAAGGALARGPGPSEGDSAPL